MTHAHRSSASANRGRLTVVFAITLTVFLVELVGGFLANSLALLADAGHMFTDVAGIGLALAAIWFAGRPASGERTFGFLRLEVPPTVLDHLCRCLSGDFDIEHSTFQLESADRRRLEEVQHA